MGANEAGQEASTSSRSHLQNGGRMAGSAKMDGDADLQETGNRVMDATMTDEFAVDSSYHATLTPTVGYVGLDVGCLVCVATRSGQEALAVIRAVKEFSGTFTITTRPSSGEPLGSSLMNVPSDAASKIELFGIQYVNPNLGNCDGTYQGERIFQRPAQSSEFVPPSRVAMLAANSVFAATTIQRYCRGFAARNSTAAQFTFQLWNTLEYQTEKETLARGKDVTQPALLQIERQIKKELEDAADEDAVVHGRQQYRSSLGALQASALGSVVEHEETMEFPVPSLSMSESGEIADLRHSPSSSLSSVPSVEVIPPTDKDVEMKAPPAPSIAARRKSTGGRRVSRRLSNLPQPPFVPDNEIDPRYKGPHLDGPVTRQFCLDLLDNFRENPSVPLPPKYAWELLTQTEENMKENIKGAVFRMAFPDKAESRIVVVGDTHGQLNDVLWIFYKFGPPAPATLFLFNGDIADRGPHAVEIFLLLFAFKLAHQDCVVINRGNHESADLNEVYGFAAEVRSKYGPKFYSKFQDIFNLLPLCIIIENRVAVVHGGLFRKDDVTLDMIDNINRKRPCPIAPRTVDDTLMFDILWSDPQSEPGRGLSTRGVDCISFGHDVTSKFLALNNLEVCIRSHQVPVNLRGFEPLHEGYCVTLFSASNYCGTTGNFGGVIIFEPDMAFEIHEYMAPNLEDIRSLHDETQQATQKVRNRAEVFKDLETRARVRNRRSSVANMQRDSIRKIARMTCEHKQVLYDKFRELDPSGSGRISPSQWREVCAEVMGKDIPWLFVQKHMKLVEVQKSPRGVATSSNGKAVDGPDVASEQPFVLFHEFLNRFRVEFMPLGSRHEGWRRETIQQVFESILQADLSLRETLMVFDRNCDGTVSQREFTELLSELNLGLTEPQLHLLLRVVASNYSNSTTAGRIDAAEFLGRFKVVYGCAIGEHVTKDRSTRAALEVIGKRILVDRKEAAQRHYESQQHGTAYDPQERRRSSAIRAVALLQKFKEYNEAGDGFLSYTDFVRAIQRLPGIDKSETALGYKLDEDAIIRLASAIDITGSGKINYLEFLNAFHVVDSSKSHFNVANEMWSFICEVLLRAKDSVMQTLYDADPSQSGRADIDDFRDALLAVNDYISSEQPLTSDQIDSLVSCIDLDDEGLVNYDDFFDAFVVVDSKYEGDAVSRGDSTHILIDSDSRRRHTASEQAYADRSTPSKSSRLEIPES